MKNEETIKSILSSGKPIISSRLPKAFSQPKHLNIKPKGDNQDAKAVNELKKIKKLLSPLKKSSPKNSAFRRVIHKLSNFPQISEKTASQTNIEMLVQSPLRLEEMITLSLLKSSTSTGTLRKSLHAPTFMLYASKEIPVSTLLTRTKLLETLKSWQRVQDSTRHLAGVSSTFWNSPEGCVTIVMEYMPGGSLLQLCDTIGAVPEQILRDMSKRILSGLAFYHSKVGSHGAVDMNHMLFDRLGKCKLAVSLSSRLKEENTLNTNTDIYSLGTSLLSASLGSSEWLSDIPRTTCCLLHDAEAVREIPYINRLSHGFKQFLCRATNYEAPASIQELAGHQWISSDENVGAHVSFREILEMAYVGGKEFQINVDKQLQALIENLKLVLNGSEDSRPSSPGDVKDLAREIGIDTEVLYNKVLEIFKKQ